MDNGRKRVYNILSYKQNPTDRACDATLRTRFSYEGEQSMSWLCASDPAEYEVECQDNSNGEIAIFYLCAQHVLWVKYNGKIYIKDDGDNICLLVPTAALKGAEHGVTVRLNPNL